MRDMNASHEASAAPIRVLLVDDHKTMLWGLERLIESAEPRMRVAGVARTVDEMLDLAARTACDVILLDLDLAGRSAVAELPKLAQRTTAAVLVLTGERDLAVHEAAIIHGARGVLSKVEPPEVILRAIERVSAGEVWVNRMMMGRVLGMLAAPRAGGKDPEAKKIASLTAREREIIAAVVRNRGAKGMAIAQALHISESTLRNHLTVIYSKLGVHNRIELFVYAGEHGLADSRVLETG
jgi:DNA-binding NarL/FixJ family response regulator